MTTDAPDWTRLFHAYGPATDTPDHLVALAGTDREAKLAAFDHLNGAIVHQGTVWTATAATVLRVVDLVELLPASLADDELEALVSWLAYALDSAQQFDAQEPVPDPAPAALEEFFATDVDESFELEVVDLLMRHAVLDVRATDARVVAAVRPNSRPLDSRCCAHPRGRWPNAWCGCSRCVPWANPPPSSWPPPSPPSGPSRRWAVGPPREPVSCWRHCTTPARSTTGSPTRPAWWWASPASTC